MNDGIDPNELTLRQLVYLHTRSGGGPAEQLPADHRARVFYLGERPPRLLTLDDIRDNLGRLISQVVSEVEETDETSGRSD